jgi:hypothetical protein
MKVHVGCGGVHVRGLQSCGSAPLAERERQTRCLFTPCIWLGRYP